MVSLALVTMAANSSSVISMARLNWVVSVVLNVGALGTSQRQLLAVLIVSVGALALTVCVALLMVFSGEPLEF